MCGRFQLSVKGKQISERYDVEVYDEMYRPSYNCAPGQYLPVISSENLKELSFYKWGLIPNRAKDYSMGNNMINARSESLDQKPAFKNLISSKKCIIPVNGFFEWKKDKYKTPFRIFFIDESIFSLAGLWDEWKDTNNNIIKSFTIVTTEANNIMKSIHHRMPVILSKETELEWLKESRVDKLKSLLKPFPDEFLKTYPISKLINSPDKDDMTLIYPQPILDL